MEVSCHLCGKTLVGETLWNSHCTGGGDESSKKICGFCEGDRHKEAD